MGTANLYSNSATVFSKVAPVWLFSTRWPGIWLSDLCRCFESHPGTRATLLSLNLGCTETAISKSNARFRVSEGQSLVRKPRFGNYASETVLRKLPMVLKLQIFRKPWFGHDKRFGNYKGMVRKRHMVRKPWVGKYGSETMGRKLWAANYGPETMVQKLWFRN